MLFKKRNLLENILLILDNSSGYDSPVYISKNAKKKNCRRKLPVTELSHDDDSSDDAISYDDFSPGDYDSDDDIKTHSIQSMRVTSTDTLVENIKYIISIPELCDVVFIVGPHRVPVYGLKAILSTRSRYLDLSVLCVCGVVVLIMLCMLRHHFFSDGI